MTLNFCQSHGQASRIARRLWHTRRAQRGQIVENLHGLGVLGRTFAQLPFIGLPNRSFRAAMVQPQLQGDGLTVSMPFVAFPVLPVYTPALDQADKPEDLPDSTYSGNVPKATAPTRIVQVVYPNASREVRIAFDVPDQSGEPQYTVECRLRTYTSGNPDIWLPTTPVVMAGYPDFAWRAGNMEGLAADARVTWFDGDEGSPPSDLHHEAAIEIDNTTPAAPSLFGAQISSSELHVRSLIFESRFLSGGSWVTADEWPVRPGDTIDIAPYIINEDYEYRVFAATSDGTRSSPQPV